MSTVIVCTDNVHTGVVDDVSVTVKPADEEAVISGAASPKTIVDLLRVNVRVCGLLTAKVRVTGVAAFHFAACPACEAVIEQLPSALIVTVPVGVIVHTVRVLLANATASLLEAVATRAYGVAPRATSAGCAKVIVCAATARGTGMIAGAKA
ncbi:MAG: hypothetical protein HQ458_03095 [Chloroflexi bacterium]|nr:hypothetical protein [Chloroflexota bacterium]